ncbi:MAG: hypothetical protein HGB05_11010, partial [Chloroflexi bacterium]|nr:hypothetical protein [Chloroflexota bacterium]
MPITYTNRKGFTYYLCRGATKTGKPRYYFAREVQDEPVEQIPEGYTISESVNGIVSLSKTQASQLRADEINAVKAAVARHPKRNKYRVNARPKRIEIYESVGPDAETLIANLGSLFPIFPGTASRLSADMERHAQFTPVLRFTLIDADTRAFDAERMCYLGSIDDFIHIGYGPLEPMASDIIVTLGTEEFFE